jgi:hypothetical protein
MSIAIQVVRDGLMTTMHALMTIILHLRGVVEIALRQEDRSIESRHREKIKSIG